ncbi:TetR/AcrR family transcriptional regulator [Salinibacillus xinjiangensis]|uniref:TetR family transcriptional regulator n=1 Tax=Salinibacillus xinjiangensis TaxID=1229268 RepID=A0A6G1X4U6_9BACI|nr:TetR/AcrR family transcriptional regulator [Salinibacillus xinjiangensis]MRG85900.1 TetR family transcriptional regulator [Salinibacillus xinjiangensis]
MNAALKEFLKNGFDKASTNEMVKEAEISKGSLFNYFQNKKDLYLYLVDYAYQIIDKVYERIDFTERDLFKRLGNVGLVKLQIQKQSPHIFDFLTYLIHEDSEEVKDVIDQKYNVVFKEGLTKIYENIDYSKFREDIDVQKAMDILTWTMVGFGEKARSEIKPFDEVGEKQLRDWESYAEILKRSFYK